MSEIRKIVESHSLSDNKRQITRNLQLIFTLPSDIKFDLIDKWLDLVLMNDVSPKVHPNLQQDINEYSNAIRWAWRALLLSRLLMQISSMPVFSLPAILSFRRQPSSDNKFAMNVAFGDVELISENTYIFIVRKAFSLCTWFSRNEPTDENKDFLYNYISKDIQKPISNTLRQGKSTFPILKAAFEQDISFRHIGLGSYQLGLGKHSVYLDKSTTENDSAIGAKMSTNKTMITHLVRSAGLPAPTNQTVSTYEEAQKAAHRLGWPVVAKPIDGERGEGVVTHIENDNVLKKAFEYALEASTRKNVIVESQVEGTCHRVFVTNGELLYAVKRMPMFVTGDGKHTISDLVSIERSSQLQLPPWKRTEISALDDVARQMLRRQGFSEDSIPASGEMVLLRPIETTRWGGIDEDVTDCIHPANIQIAIDAARLFRLEVAGVDIISKDIKVPWYENGAIINEINFAPLLGGGEISRKHINSYLDRILPQRGRIAVDVFVGGDRAWELALETQANLAAQGITVYLTNQKETRRPDAREHTLACQGLGPRIRALTLDKTIEYIIAVVHDNELLRTGYPIEWVDKVTIVDSNLYSQVESGNALTERESNDLLGLCRNWQRS